MARDETEAAKALRRRIFHSELQRRFEETLEAEGALREGDVRRIIDEVVAAQGYDPPARRKEA